eukprot:scaffold313385_cov19-Prasinocladus_malaysianus.AAC.1
MPTKQNARSHAYIALLLCIDPPALGGDTCGRGAEGGDSKNARELVNLWHSLVAGDHIKVR